jgi:hypothetical protein
MARRTICGVILVPAVILSFIVGWILMFPSRGDPKNIQYILWKAGIYRMPIEVAADTMIGDVHPEELVVGKTKAQLQNRFGPLLSPLTSSRGDVNQDYFI